VKQAQSFRLVDERLLLCFSQLTPASTKPLTYLGVMHVWPDRRDLLALDLQAHEPT